MISRSILSACFGLLLAFPAAAVVPEHTVEKGAVRLKGVGPDNPVL
jgi:hypothetical protein